MSKGDFDINAGANEYYRLMLPECRKIGIVGKKFAVMMMEHFWNRGYDQGKMDAIWESRCYTLPVKSDFDVSTAANVYYGSMLPECRKMGIVGKKFVVMLMGHEWMSGYEHGKMDTLREVKKYK